MFSAHDSHVIFSCKIMRMELRRRVGGIPETLAPSTCLAGVGEKSKEQKNPLVVQGLQLYQQAEQDRFMQNEVLEESLRCFVLASENGDEEATSWIKAFLDSMSALPVSVVLPDKLVGVMRWLTEASQADRQVRVVARSLFSKMSGARESIPIDGMDESVKRLFVDSKRKLHPLAQAPGIVKSSKLLVGSVKRLMHDAMNIEGSKEVSEEAFIEAALRYAKGDIGSLSTGGVSDLSPQQLEDFKHANILKKVYAYPWHFLQHYKLSLLRTIEKRGVRWIWSSIPTKQFYLLLVAYLLPMLTANFIVSSMFTMVFIVAFGCAIFATLQVIVNSEKEVLLLEYSSIFEYFNESTLKINSALPHFHLIRHAIVPYVTFMISFTVVLLSMGLAHQQLVSYELLAVIACGISLTVFLQFEVYKSLIVLISMSTRLISWSYVLLSIIATFKPIPDFLFFPRKGLFTVPLFAEIQIEFNLISLLQIPVQLYTIAYLLYTKAWRNFFSGLGPCALFLCWFVLCRNFLSLSSPHALLWTGIGVLGLMSLAPFFPLVFVTSPMFFAFYYGVSRPFFISLTFVIIVSSVIVLFAAKFKQLQEARWLHIPIEYLFLLPVVTSIPLILFGSSLCESIYEPSSLKVVSVGEYAEYCGPKNWNHSGNMVQTQVNCFHLQNRLFEGHGIVSMVKISQFVDDYESTLGALPSSVKTALTCVLGQSEPMCGDQPNMTSCVYAGCNFHHRLHFMYEIRLDMSLKEEYGLKVAYNATEHISVSLLTSNKHRQKITNISRGMFVRFNATFFEGMGSNELVLKALSILMPGEVVPIKEHDELEETAKHFMHRFVVSLKTTIYFVLEILFGYTSPKI